MALVAGEQGCTPTAYHNLDHDDEPPWWHDNYTNLAGEERSIDEIDELKFLEEEFGDPSEFVAILARNKPRATAR